MKDINIINIIEGLKRYNLLENKIESTKIDEQLINKMLSSIGKIESELDVLWSQTDAAGFCYLYPERCLEILSYMRNILEMELRSQYE